MSKKKVEFSDAAKEAFKNKAFVQRLLTLETGEEVREALREKGIVLSADELDKFAEVLIVALEKGQEMTDNDLEEVVGGVLGNASLLAAAAKNLGGFAANSYFAKKKKCTEERDGPFGI
jgi:NTP pyrophosphatase (non-canonical NTP hydrolase)